MSLAVSVAVVVTAMVPPLSAQAATTPRTSTALTANAPTRTAATIANIHPVTATVTHASKKTPKKRKLVVKGSTTSKIQKQNAKVTIKGNINHSRAKGYIVKLQRWNYGWKTIATKRVKGKKFTFRNVKVWPRDTWLQLVTPAQGKYRSDDSRNMLVAVSRCSTLSKAPGQVSTFFTNGKAGTSYAPTAITAAFIRGICSAAPRATMRIAMYYAIFGNLTKGVKGAGSIETSYLQRALEYVKSVRHVRISLLMEGKQFPKSKAAATLYRQNAGYGLTWRQVVQTKATLKRLTSGRVWYCRTGCRNTLNDSPGNLHSKYVLVNNTVWKTGRDPLVINGSANFSSQQLRRTVNDLTQIYNNKKIYSAFSNDWIVNQRCYVRLKHHKSCGVNNGLWSVATTSKGQRWFNNYGQPTNAGRRWDDTSAMPTGFPGDPGKGIMVFFSPVETYKYDDYITNILRQLRCSRSQHTIKMLIPAVGTPKRTKYFFAELKRLAASGCDIKIVLDGPSGNHPPKQKVDNRTPSAPASLKVLKSMLGSRYAKGGSVTVRCREAQHSKAYVFDAQRRLGAPSQDTNSSLQKFPWTNFDAVLAGSPNMTAGLLYGSESAELMAVQDAKRQGDRKGIQIAVKRYSKHFDDVWHASGTGRCYWSY